MSPAGGASPNVERNVRRLELYAQALWGNALRIEALTSSADIEAPERVWYRARQLSLPLSWLEEAGPSVLCRAAVAHAAAHLAFGGPLFSPGKLKPLQLQIISLLEDARVERLARKRFEGLKELWLPFHAAAASEETSAAALLTRLARALADDDYVDVESWVDKARRAFRAATRRGLDAEQVRELGGGLGNDIGQMRLQFDGRSWQPAARYQDDPRGLWDFEEASDAQVEELRALQASDGASRRDRRAEAAQPLRPQAQADDLAAAAPDPASAAELRLAADTKVRVAYPEWDERIGSERPAWCTVCEPAFPASDPQTAGRAANSDRGLVRRLRRFTGTSRSEPRWLTRQLDGDELDLAGWLEALAQLRARGELEQRVYRRRRRVPTPSALLVLLDLSASTALPWPSARGALPGAWLPGERLPARAPSVLDVARSAGCALGEASREQPEMLAIHGFRSNGRHAVEYLRLKDFGEAYGARTRRRLAALEGRLSTRVGTALRHAGRLLLARRSERRCLVLVTDGEPSDIDVYDPEYLAGDARRSVLELRRARVSAYCLSVGARDQAPMERIFGSRATLHVGVPRDLARRLLTLQRQLSR